MTECLTPPRRIIVNICARIPLPVLAERGSRPPGQGELMACHADPRLAAEEDDDEAADDEDLGMPLPDDDDPDWGFEDEETQPEQGDFWFDSNDEEDAL